MATHRPSEKSHNATAGDIEPFSSSSWLPTCSGPAVDGRKGFIMLADARIAFVINSDTSSSAVSARSGRPHSLTTCRACRRAQGTAESSAPSSRWLMKGHSAGSGREIAPPGSDRADTGTGPGTPPMGIPRISWHEYQYGHLLRAELSSPGKPGRRQDVSGRLPTV